MISPTKKIAIIDYGAGNLHSVMAALKRIAHEDSLLLTSKASDLQNTSHIILPGVGAFADCMNGLCALKGMREELNKQVLENKIPFLGICVGMQMMLEYGYEHGKHQGLGWIKGSVRSMDSKNGKLKIPHMGWNNLLLDNPQHPLLKNIHEGEHAYFVHSYHAICENPQEVIASTEHGEKITAIIAQDNLYGTQFHPEKSQKLGDKILTNFLNI